MGLKVREAAAALLVLALLALAAQNVGVSAVAAATGLAGALVAVIVGGVEFGPVLSRRVRRRSRPHVFVAYAREHAKQARSLAAALEVAQATVRLDEWPAHVGTDLGMTGRSRGLLRSLPHSNPAYRQLRSLGVDAEALESADVLVLVGFSESGTAAAEILLARRYSTKIVRIDFGSRKRVQEGPALEDDIVRLDGLGRPAAAAAARRVLARA